MEKPAAPLAGFSPRGVGGILRLSSTGVREEAPAAFALSSGSLSCPSPQQDGISSAVGALNLSWF
jgi:hypothetical protein